MDSFFYQIFKEFIPKIRNLLNTVVCKHHRVFDVLVELPTWSIVIKQTKMCRQTISVRNSGSQFYTICNQIPPHDMPA